MGRIGFVFEIDLNDSLGFKKIILKKDKDLFLNKKYTVVFVEFSKFKSDFIVYSHKFDLNNASFYYLSKDLILENYNVFDNPKFLLAKICVNDKTVIDYDALTFWFSAKKYKILKYLFNIDDFKDNLEDEIKKRVLDIYEYF